MARTPTTERQALRQSGVLEDDSRFHESDGHLRLAYDDEEEIVGVVCGLSSHRHDSVFQGRICAGNCACYLTETEVTDQTICPIQSQRTDTRLTSPSADTVMPGTWQGSHWITNY